MGVKMEYIKGNLENDYGDYVYLRSDAEMDSSGDMCASAGAIIVDVSIVTVAYTNSLFPP